jgi:hypothetical protein
VVKKKDLKGALYSVLVERRPLNSPTLEEKFQNRIKGIKFTQRTGARSSRHCPCADQH